MDNPMDKKVSRRSLLGGGLKAAAALGAGSGPVAAARAAGVSSKQAIGLS